VDDKHKKHVIKPKYFNIYVPHVLLWAVQNWKFENIPNPEFIKVGSFRQGLVWLKAQISFLLLVVFVILIVTVTRIFCMVETHE
jgi:hypothetical protein